MDKIKLKMLLVVLPMLLAVQSIKAQVKVADVFADNMVLQADKKITVWGTAAMMESVTVALNGVEVTVRAGINEKWQVELPPMKYGGPFDLNIYADDTLTLKNVMIGEVWLCTGQSNMRMSVKGALNPKQEIAAANYSDIRFFTVPQKGTTTLQNNVDADWQICSPETIGSKTAAGYYFARKLSKELNVAVGIIDVSFGGASILTFMDQATIQSTVDTARIAMGNNGRSNIIKQRVIDWENNGRKGNRPYLPQAIASLCYNAMVNPIIPFANRGALWYQGEANANRSDAYVHWFGDYITMMRDKFNNQEMPFYFVQLAGFENQHNTDLPAEMWANFRLSQEQCLQYPNTGMVTAMDIGQKDNIHPKNKQEVGLRLAMYALNQTYGKTDIICKGPTISSIKQGKGKVIITFDNCAKGLKTKEDKKEVLGFLAVLSDGKKVALKGKIISKNELMIKGKNITTLYYAYANYPICNLYNSANLPALPFKYNLNDK